MAKIKLVSLNIERDQHYDTVLPFLKAQQADVVCLQEILDRDVDRFKKELCLEGFYAPTGLADRGRHTEALGQAGICMGTALLSRLPLADIRSLYYFGTPEHVPSSKDPVPQGRHENFNGVLLTARVRSGEDWFEVGTTHFTWTPNGTASEAQREDMKALLKILAEFQDIVFCGDFNAPREREIWNTLASRYKDNIPAEYETSIDQKLHITPEIKYVVDGLFSTPKYRVSDVRLVDGISDHKAIVGIIERIS